MLRFKVKAHFIDCDVYSLFENKPLVIFLSINYLLHAHNE